MPNFSQGLPAYYVLATAEASSNLARYDGVRYRNTLTWSHLQWQQLITIHHGALKLAWYMCPSLLSWRQVWTSCKWWRSDVHVWQLSWSGFRSRGEPMSELLAFIYQLHSSEAHSFVGQDDSNNVWLYIENNIQPKVTTWSKLQRWS